MNKKDVSNAAKAIEHIPKSHKLVPPTKYSATGVTPYSLGINPDSESSEIEMESKPLISQCPHIGAFKKRQTKYSINYCNQ